MEKGTENIPRRSNVLNTGALALLSRYILGQNSSYLKSVGIEKSSRTAGDLATCDNAVGERAATTYVHFSKFASEKEPPENLSSSPCRKA